MSKMLSSEEGRYFPLSQKNLLRTENIFRNFTGLKLIFSASLAHKDSNNYVAMDRSYHHFSMIGGIYNLSSLSIAFRQWLSMKWHVMAVKDVYYLGINLYAKGNLSLMIKSQSLLMVFQPFADFCDGLQQWVNLQWKMVKDAKNLSM